VEVDEVFTGDALEGLEERVFAALAFLLRRMPPDAGEEAQDFGCRPQADFRVFVAQVMAGEVDAFAAAIVEEIGLGDAVEFVPFVGVVECEGAEFVAFDLDRFGGAFPVPSLGAALGGAEERILQQFAPGGRQCVRHGLALRWGG
jgi:hypothetical protein